MKKYLSFVLVTAMLTVPILSTQAQATAFDPLTDYAEQYAQAIISSNPDAPLVSDGDESFILSQFSRELRYISSRTGLLIDHIDYDTLELIKQVACAELSRQDYNFVDLISTISDAATAQKFLIADAYLASTYAIDSGFEIQNRVSKTLQSMGPLSGKINSEYVPVNNTSTKSITIKVDVSVPLKGFTLTSGFNINESLTVTGPSANQMLSSGVAKATHAAAYAVLFGEIKYLAYDVVETATGNRTHSTFRYVEDSTKYMETYTLFVSKGQPTYADHARLNKTLNFANVAAFERNAQNAPEAFVN